MCVSYPARACGGQHIVEDFKVGIADSLFSLDQGHVGLTGNSGPLK